MKVLIFGSTGFIGKNLVATLSQDDKYEIFECSKSSGADMTKYDEIYEVLKKHQPEVIFNVAANVGSLHYVTTYAADVMTDNIQMALNLYKAVKNTCPTAKIINPLANCSYPEIVKIQDEKHWLNGPIHPSVFSFGNSKRVTYFLSKCYYEQFGIKTVNLIFPNTYGPGDSCDPNKTHALNGMIIRMLKAKKNKDKEFVVWGTGKPIREWAYVDDFVNALIYSIQIDHMEYPVNVAQEKGYSIADSAALIKDACGFDGEIIFDLKYPDGDAIKILKNDRFMEIFSDFNFYDHKKGIVNTVEYYAQKMNL